MVTSLLSNHNENIAGFAVLFHSNYLLTFIQSRTKLFYRHFAYSDKSFPCLPLKQKIFCKNIKCSIYSTREKEILIIGSTNNNKYTNTKHCVKSVQIRSFFWSECGKIPTRKNSVFGHFSRSDSVVLYGLNIVL